MINVVYINNKGFIDTFDKTTNNYKTTHDIGDAYFSYRSEEASSVADFFDGMVVSFEVE